MAARVRFASSDLKGANAPIAHTRLSWGCWPNIEEGATTKSKHHCYPLWAVIAAVALLAGSCTESPPFTTGVIYDNPPKLMEQSISPAPKLRDIAELTIKIDNRGGGLSWYTAKNTRVWVEFYWTNIHGSYAEARGYVPVPVEEVSVSGQTSWSIDDLTPELVSPPVRVPRLMQHTPWVSCHSMSCVA
jgi:hypothetical protein